MIYKTTSFKKLFQADCKKFTLMIHIQREREKKRTKERERGRQFAFSAIFPNFSEM
jgi:hypothetical protein